MDKFTIIPVGHVAIGVLVYGLDYQEGLVRIGWTNVLGRYLRKEWNLVYLFFC